MSFGGYKILHERDGVKALGPEPNTKANALADSQLRFVGALRVTKPHGLSNTSSHSPPAEEEDQACCILFMWQAVCCHRATSSAEVLR